MSSVKPKPRKKIKYIGKPPTYEEMMASYNIKPKVLEEVHRLVDEYYARKESRRRAKKSASPKKVRVAK
jgi:hypothetical protein